MLPKISLIVIILLLVGYTEPDARIMVYPNSITTILVILSLAVSSSVRFKSVSWHGLSLDSVVRLVTSMLQNRSSYLHSLVSCARDLSFILYTGSSDELVFGAVELCVTIFVCAIF